MFSQNPRHVVIFSLRAEKSHSSWWKARRNVAFPWPKRPDSQRRHYRLYSTDDFCSTDAGMNLVRCSESDARNHLFSHQQPLPCIPTSADFQWHCVQITVTRRWTNTQALYFRGTRCFKVKRCALMDSKASIKKINKTTCWAFKVAAPSQAVRSGWSLV